MTEWDFTLLLLGGLAFAAILFIGACAATLSVMNAQVMLPPIPPYSLPAPPPPSAPEPPEAAPRTLH
jgi:hypothetical protein